MSSVYWEIDVVHKISSDILLRKYGESTKRQFRIFSGLYKFKNGL